MSSTSGTKKIPTMSVKLSESVGPYVLALDVGSTASRGGLYDATGRPVKGSKERIAHAFTTAGDGTSTIDAGQVVDECAQIVDAVVAFAEENRLVGEVTGVAMDSFASSLILVDADGDALTPCLTYADSRSHRQVRFLQERVDEADYHARTGVRLHTSYHPSRLLWLQQEDPETFARTHAAMTIGEYVYLRLAGIRGIATSMAAWSGILDLHTGELDLPILQACGTDPDLFAAVHDPDQPARPAADALPEKWRMLADADWFHAIPDGWPSNIGPGAVDSSTAAVAAATSGAMRVIVSQRPGTIPDGLWCYRLSRAAWILGGALNDVGRAVEWLENTVAPVDGELGEVLAGPPRDDAPAVLPFFSGERATGWASDARASLVGLTTATGPADLWRGVVEGLALSYRRVWDALGEAGAQPERVIASGRVTIDHPAWLQPLADSLEVPVVPLAMKRATLRGTALIALDVLAPDVGRATPPFDEAWSPVAGHAGHYRHARGDFERLYTALVAD
ncbi:gluconokinase [Corynebacterium halotolerans]|uniref:Gluconokinase n=1 Tax=Corynebacterium halotolerans YIM 70093 = DSM 44683 TaxID=1121362 RepID=M1NQT8_9CORY|nr:gluconokinase [Corynebacterium halotolerans]AGF73743.1 gluconokinase [Corynebacterium halotolerans YIM 70093 = DSM 44683]